MSPQAFWKPPHQHVDGQLMPGITQVTHFRAPAWPRFAKLIASPVGFNHSCPFDLSFPFDASSLLDPLLAKSCLSHHVVQLGPRQQGVGSN